MLIVQTKSDAQLKHDVTAELSWEPRVDDTLIGVQVHEGVVTLTGMVQTYAEKMAAQDAAHRVSGVHDVANDIQVRVAGAWKRSDADLALAVRSALEWDALVPDERIHSTVSNGWVTLTGTVDRWTQREDAARAVRNLQGVLGVTNSIMLQAPAVDAEAIRRGIEQALHRQAEREADRVIIEVNDGVVSLGGRVRTWAEKRAIRGVAGCAPGVRAIEDHVVIDPSW